ncbi:MAG: acyltransferase [Alphaproteobacteria bacterium]|nr:acyltransferase [Alphaproteobacteria bacterium]
MRKLLIRLICCFIPSQKARHNFRHKYLSHYKLHGDNNRIYVGETLLKKSVVSGIYIDIYGNNNTIYLPNNFCFEQSSIFIRANNSKIVIKPTKYKIKNFRIGICCGDNQSIQIGENFYCHGCAVNLNEDNSSVIIGESCLFSNSISIWATDGHVIMEHDTYKILNHLSEPVQIGNHCWIGEGVKILKNAIIPDNTIVGMGTVVTKRFVKPNTILAGNPAKVIKENVDWDHATPSLKLKQIKKNKGII